MKLDCQNDGKNSCNPEEDEETYPPALTGVRCMKDSSYQLIMP